MDEATNFNLGLGGVPIVMLTLLRQYAACHANTGNPIWPVFQRAVDGELARRKGQAQAEEVIQVPRDAEPHHLAGAWLELYTISQAMASSAEDASDWWTKTNCGAGAMVAVVLSLATAAAITDASERLLAELGRRPGQTVEPGKAVN